MILAKWSSRVQPWRPRAPIFVVLEPLEPWNFLVRSPGALNPFGTLRLCILIAVLVVHESPEGASNKLLLDHTRD